MTKKTLANTRTNQHNLHHHRCRQGYCQQQQRQPYRFPWQSDDTPGTCQPTYTHSITELITLLYLRKHRYAETACFKCPSVLWRCWLGDRKGIRPVKTEWWGAGMVLCLEQGTDLHIVWPSWWHCHSLSLASVKSRLVLPFWYRLTWVVPEKGR